MSLVKNKSLAKNKTELEIFVDAKTFQDACKKVYLKEVKKINIRGFRKGKAPKKVIEKMYGHDVFFSAAMDLVCPRAVDEAITEAGIDVVSLEKIEPIEISEQNGFSFKAVCVLKPEVEIKDYKGIKIKHNVPEVNEELVNQHIENLRQRNGRLVNVEKDRAAQMDDVVFIDYEGYVDGKKFQGGSAKNQNLKLGSGQFIKGFEEQVVGHKIGDSFEVDVVFPENYHVADLKSKKAKFKCKLNEIKILELPKVDDEFAKDISNFDTLKELKDDLTAHLKNQVENQKNEQTESQILNFLASNVVVDIPEVMIDNKTDDLAKNFENRLASRGLNLNQYLMATRTSGYVLKDDLKSKAEFQIKTDLALEKIAKLENLEVTVKDFEDERSNIAKIYKVEVDKIKNLFPDSYLKPSLQLRKAFEFVKDNAEIEKIVSKPNVAKNKNEQSDKKNLKSEKNSSEKSKVGSKSETQQSSEGNLKSETVSKSSSGASSKTRKTSRKTSGSKASSAKNKVSKTTKTTKSTKSKKVTNN